MSRKYNGNVKCVAELSMKYPGSVKKVLRKYLVSVEEVLSKCRESDKKW